MQRSRFTPRASTARAQVARVQASAADVFLRLAIVAAVTLIFLVATAMRASAATQPVSNTLGALDSTTHALDANVAPNPRLAPEDVVGIVLDALARNDEPVKDHGISITFSFSSPANRAFVGPLESFADLVRDDTYRPLLNHRHASRGPAHITGDRATVRVIVTTASGERVAYLFALSLQTDGQYKGCWMTDGVTREPPSPLQGMRFAERGTRELVGRS